MRSQKICYAHVIIPLYFSLSIYCRNIHVINALFNRTTIFLFNRTITRFFLTLFFFFFLLIGKKRTFNIKFNNLPEEQKNFNFGVT